MKIATVAEVAENFSTYLEASRSAPLVITRNDSPVALLIAIGDEADLDSLLIANNFIDVGINGAYDKPARRH